jgi:hypothetical protein
VLFDTLCIFFISTTLFKIIINYNSHICEKVFVLIAVYLHISVKRIKFAIIFLLNYKANITHCTSMIAQKIDMLLCVSVN